MSKASKDKSKAWKITIAGSYRKADGEIVDFEKVTGHVPFCEEEIAKFHVIGRYAEMWIRTDTERFKDRMDSMVEVHIDDIEEVEVDAFSYEGEDIKEMSQEQLQDLATAKDLREIKTFKFASIREARAVAYTAYAQRVLGNKDPAVDYRDGSFNFAKLPPLYADRNIRKEVQKTVSNEEVIKAEAEGVNTTLTMDDLKKIADEKSIPYTYNIGFATLYNRIFGSGGEAAAA